MMLQSGRSAVVALAVATGVALAATGCTASDGPPGPMRAVEVADGTGDVQGSRSDGGPVPRGGLDLAGAVLRDEGDVLVAEFRIEDGGAASPDSAAPGADDQLIYLVHLWGEDPDNWFTVHAMVETGDGTTAAPGDPVHVCAQVPQLGRCEDAEVEPVGAVVGTDGRFTFEVPWEVLGTARTDGFDWLAGAAYTQVEGERWDQWFDDAPDRPDPVPTVSGPGPHSGGPIFMPGGFPPPDTAASFPALGS